MSRVGAISRATCAAAVAFALTGCGSTQTRVDDLGGGAHAMSKRSGLAGARSAALKVQLEQEALAYCAARGEALTMLDTKTDDPDPPNVSSATVQFRCVAP